MGALLTGLCAGSEFEGIFAVYDVGDVIGQGTFGEVRDCRRKSDSEEYAVKVVDRQAGRVTAEEAYSSIREEAVILKALDHAHIIQLVDVFEDQRFVYVVMEKVLGGELFQALKLSDAVIAESHVARVAGQLFKALAYLHGKGVVHRDVKPQNILLTEPPAQGGGAPLAETDIKLIDFGLSATLQRDRCGLSTAPEQQLDLVCGTPSCCAPEIWACLDSSPPAWRKRFGSTYGPRVDVWAAGVVIYLAVLGCMPYDQRKVEDLAEAVCSPEVKPRFSSKRGNFKPSEAFKQLVSRVLEKDQAKRLTASEAAEDKWPAGAKKRTEPLEIPLEVRQAAAEEAELALRLGAASVDLAAQTERKAAFEEARANALTHDDGDCESSCLLSDGGETG